MPGDPVPANDRKKLSVIVPCFNERDTVRTLLERVLAVVMPEGWEREIIVVDDASTDGTRGVLESLDLPVRIIYRAANGGKGTALVDGFGAATGTHLIIQDADLEYDPSDIPTLLSALDTERTAVYGSRNLRPHEREGSYVLRAGVWLLTELTNRLYGTQLTDACTCYKLFPRSAIPLFAPGRFDADILFAPALARNGYRIREVPVAYEPRSVAEGKKIGYGDGLHALWALLRDYGAHRSRSGIMPVQD